MDNGMETKVDHMDQALNDNLTRAPPPAMQAKVDGGGGQTVEQVSDHYSEEGAEHQEDSLQGPSMASGLTSEINPTLTTVPASSSGCVDQDSHGKVAQPAAGSFRLAPRPSSLMKFPARDIVSFEVPKSHPFEGASDPNRLLSLLTAIPRRLVGGTSDAVGYNQLSFYKETH